MLNYITTCITAFLVFKILRASRRADATGYLLVSGIIPLPVYMIGNSVDAGVFPIDVCLLVYLLAHGKAALHYAQEHRILSAGIGALFGFSLLATCSGVFNFLFVDPGALKFYAFTIVKFWEYALLATVLIASRPDARQLRSICTIVLTGILVYEILHALHISGIVPMSGEAYYGPRAEGYMGGAVSFSDRTGWFLASYRGIVGGTVSIGAWLSLMVFEAYRGKIKILAAATGILSVFSVLAVNSREDIAGLAAGAIVFALCAPPRRWKVYACAAIAGVGLYAIVLTVFLTPANRSKELTRMSALWNSQQRLQGNYGSRLSNWTSMLSYLPDHPEDLVIGAGPGNYRAYAADGATYLLSGHNSYLTWTGELGLGGLFLLLAWCGSVCLYAARCVRNKPRICQLAARTCFALVVGRMVAGWAGEALLGTDGMGYYSLYMVGIVYLLISVASDVGAPTGSLHLQGYKLKKSNTAVSDMELAGIRCRS